MNSRLGKILAAMLTVCIAADSMALTGKWRGDLNMGVAKLTLIFNFNETPDGKTTAMMDCPQQNAKNIPLDVVVCTPDSIGIQNKMIGASYSGKIKENRIEGTFIQNGYKLPLSLTPEEDLSIRRPQTPVPPFPYVVKDTVFYSSDGTELAGTLTIPASSVGKSVPIIVMVTGSGPQNRDEEVFEHRPFAVIADYLARNGVASFRYDDRGVASSKGNFQEATLKTFKEDAKSALNFTKTLSGFDRHGILGHSEGGTLALLLAAEEKPDFIVSLAGVAIPFKEVLLSQNAHFMDHYGITGKQKEASIKLIEIGFDMIKAQYAKGETTPLDIDRICKENSLDVPLMVIQSVKQNMLTRNEYFDSLVSCDPTESLRKIKCPVLAVNGTKDIQVDADSNLKALRTNVKNVGIRLMEGLNHIMQHAGTGEMTEYGDIRETISPEVLDIITEFIKRQ